MAIRKRILLAALLPSMGLLPQIGDAQAAVFTYQFEATVSSLHGGSPAAYDQFLGLNSGDTITGWFSYDTSATERTQTQGDVHLGEYWSPSASAQFTLFTPARTYSLIAPASVSIRIEDGFLNEDVAPNQYADAFGLSVSDPYVGSENPTQVGLSILLKTWDPDTPPSVLPSDAIPGALPPLGQWTARRHLGLSLYGTASGEPDGYEMGLSAEVTALTLIPEPALATCAAACSLLAVAALTRRRREGSAAAR